MKRAWLLIILTVLLLGCTKTEIVSEPITSEETSAVQETPASTSKEMIATECSDSDSGIDETTRGGITGAWIDGTSFDNTDDCLGFVYLIEYYCEDGQPRSQNFRCENECKNGICQ
ncbi:hypothetical protein ACFLZ7_02520 [Nanoarchaeota archaeon]